MDGLLQEVAVHICRRPFVLLHRARPTAFFKTGRNIKAANFSSSTAFGNRSPNVCVYIYMFVFTHQPSNPENKTKTKIINPLPTTHFIQACEGFSVTHTHTPHTLYTYTLTHSPYNDSPIVPSNCKAVIKKQKKSKTMCKAIKPKEAKKFKKHWILL